MDFLRKTIGIQENDEEKLKHDDFEWISLGKHYSTLQIKVLKVLEKIVPNVINNRNFDEDGARAD